MCFGWVSGWLRLLDASAVHKLNAFVFHFGIPALVFRGLAINDFDLLDWRFVGLFFLIRCICVVAVGVFTAVTKWAGWETRDFVGAFLVHL